jgi:putative endonuclease
MSKSLRRHSRQSREKQLKNWRRDWKIQLIEENNLHWGDLSHLL